jgi:hypothetical protein
MTVGLPAEIWPPFAAPEGLIAVSAGAWIAAAVLGLWFGLWSAARGARRRDLVVGLLLVLVAAIAGYAVFDGARMITFPVLDGEPRTTLLLPLGGCDGVADYAPGGRDRATAMPEDIRLLQGQRGCALPTAASTAVFFALSFVIVFVSASFLALGLGAIMNDPKLARLVRAIEAFVQRFSHPS